MKISTKTLFSALLAALPCTLAWAQPHVVLAPATAELTTEQTLALTAWVEGSAGLAGPAPIRWQWRVLEPEGGSISHDGWGRGTYQPPALVFGTEETFTLQAQAVSLGGISAQTRVTVRNGTVMARLMPSFLGQGWLEPRLELLAGHAWESGSLPGRAEAARMGNVRNLVHVPHHPDPRIAGNFLASDTENDTILVVNPSTGEVWTWLGEPGQPFGEKHRNGQGTAARFSGPGHLAVRPGGGTGDIPWQCVILTDDVARIRSVDAKGNVTTLLAQEKPPADWAFPIINGRDWVDAGLAMGADGAVYFGNRKRRVISKIAGGRVRDLAGSSEVDPDDPEEQRDGFGAEARFRWLKGFAMDESSGDLLVCDLDAIRRVSPEGKVTTVAGALLDHKNYNKRRGFEQDLDLPGLVDGPERLAGIPCFDNPTHITISNGEAFISEAGNHTIRVLNLATGRLSTLAGDPNPSFGPDHPLMTWARGRDWSVKGTHFVYTREPFFMNEMVVRNPQCNVKVFQSQRFPLGRCNVKTYEPRYHQGDWKRADLDLASGLCFVDGSTQPLKGRVPDLRYLRWGLLRNGQAKAPEGGALLDEPGQVAFDASGATCLLAQGTCIGELTLDRRRSPAVGAAAGAGPKREGKPWSAAEAKEEPKVERKQELIRVVRAADLADPPQEPAEAPDDRSGCAVM